LKFIQINEKFENVFPQPGESPNNVKRLNNITIIATSSKPGINNKQQKSKQ
jgi:hypothetical protein